DIEMASASAPNAPIEVAACRDTAANYFGGLIAFENIVQQTNHPNIVSVSYGDCELHTGSHNSTFNTWYSQAAAEGISVFVSSGDQLAAVCDRGAPEAVNGIAVNGWGSTPYNVSVGGTDFSDYPSGTVSTYWSTTNGANYGSAKSYVPEIPW